MKQRTKITIPDEERTQDMDTLEAMNRQLDTLATKYFGYKTKGNTTDEVERLLTYATYILFRAEVLLNSEQYKYKHQQEQ